jgi:hypothetical protein
MLVTVCVLSRKAARVGGGNRLGQLERHRWQDEQRAGAVRSCILVDRRQLEATPPHTEDVAESRGRPTSSDQSVGSRVARIRHAAAPPVTSVPVLRGSHPEAITLLSPLRGGVQWMSARGQVSPTRICR